MYRLPRRMVDETFSILRSCGAGKRECKLYWLSRWSAPNQLTTVTHPTHDATRSGVTINDRWLTEFWNELSDRDLGVRVQVHTHPERAFHSRTDDAYPLIHEIGFLSLVIPNFAQGQNGFDGAYLTEIQPNGSWRQVAMDERLIVHE